MDRIVNTVSARLDRSGLYEGSARRLNPQSANPEFRAMLNATPEETTEPPAVSGWAGLVTAGKTGVGDEPTPAVPAPEPEPAPTLESVFGENPWVTAPAGQGPLGVYYYNPMYFATTQTAEKVAQLMGGKVVQANAFCSSAGSPFQQLQANNMVELPNGRVINPGLVATFYMRGYSQSYIDHLLAVEANGMAS